MKSAGKVGAVKGLMTSTLEDLASAVQRVGRDVLDAISPKDWFGLVSKAAFSPSKAPKAARFAASAKAALDEGRNARCAGAAGLIYGMYDDPAKRAAACRALAGLTKNVFERAS